MALDPMRLLDDPALRALLQRPGGSPLRSPSGMPAGGMKTPDRPTGGGMQLLNDPALRSLVGARGAGAAEAPHGMGPMSGGALSGRPDEAPGRALEADPERAAASRAGRAVDDALSSFDEAKMPPPPVAPDAPTAPGAGDSEAPPGAGPGKAPLAVEQATDRERPPDFQRPQDQPSGEPEKKRSGFWNIAEAIGNAMAKLPPPDRDKRDARDRANAARDPNSDVSRAARKRWREYLVAAGWGDTEVDRMSAADLDGMDIKDVASFRNESARRREELGTRTAAEVAAQQAKNERDERHRAEDEANKLARDGRQNAAAEERARIIAGAQATRIANQNKREDEQINTRLTREDEKAIADRTVQYGEKLRSSGVVDMGNDLDTMEKMVADRRARKNGQIFDDPALAKMYANPAAIPVVGNLTQWLAEKNVSPDDRKLLELEAKIRNAVNAKEFGASQSEGEVLRGSMAQATGLGADPESTQRYFETVRGGLRANRASIDASYGPDVVERYNTNLKGGGAAKGAGGKGKGAKGGKRVRYTDPSDGVVKTAAARKETIDQLIAAEVPYEEVE